MPHVPSSTPNSNGPSSHSGIHGEREADPGPTSDAAQPRQCRLRVGLVCAWYDCWFGLFFDPKKRILYAMIPFIGFKFWFEPDGEPVTPPTRYVPDDPGRYLLESPQYMLGRIHGTLLYDRVLEETPVGRTYRYPSSEKVCQKISKLFELVEEDRRSFLKRDNLALKDLLRK